MQYNMGRSGLSDVVFLPHFSLGTHSRSVLVILPPSSIHPSHHPSHHPSIHPTQYIVDCTSDCTLYHPVSFSSSWPCENSDKQVGQVGYRIPKVGSDLTFLHQQQQSWTSPPQHGPVEFASCHHPHTFPLSN